MRSEVEEQGTYGGAAALITDLVAKNAKGRAGWWCAIGRRHRGGRCERGEWLRQWAVRWRREEDRILKSF